jgi:DNA-binding IclR family transcriptional regulator
VTAMPVPADSLSARQPKAIQSALTVLEEVARRGPGVTAQEISQALGMPRATAYRLLNLLVQDEYLVRMPDLRGFTLGHKVIELAHLVAPIKAPDAAMEVISGLRASIRGGVHLVRYKGERITVIDTDPDFPLSDEGRIVRELDASAMGRLLLAELAVRGDGPASSRVSPASLSDLAQCVARAGYAQQVDLLIPGFGCIAVPIRKRTGQLIGSLTLSIPSARVRNPGDAVNLLRAGAEKLAPLLP